MALRKSKCWYSNSSLHFFKCAVPLKSIFLKKVEHFSKLNAIFLVLCKIEHFLGNKILIFKLDFEEEKKLAARKSNS
jgi:hypothetical protein